MAYAEKADMEGRYGASEMDSLAAALGNPSIGAALDDAAGEIDGYLARRYALPLPSGKKYPLLRWLSCDVARYRLWEGKISDEVDTVYMRYRRAVKVLEDLASGDALLVSEDGEAAPLSGQGGSMRVRSERKKVFTNDVLRSMDYGVD
jgi:phage gp36-like protein